MFRKDKDTSLSAASAPTGKGDDAALSSAATAVVGLGGAGPQPPAGSAPTFSEDDALYASTSALRAAAAAPTLVGGAATTATRHPTTAAEQGVTAASTAPGASGIAPPFMVDGGLVPTHVEHREDAAAGTPVVEPTEEEEEAPRPPQ